jgi:integrative and conjugative element protein (TIGR02256 family)
MINVILPNHIEETIKQELKAAGSSEMGGVLMGEHVNEGTFRIIEVTIQRHGGTVITFIRDIKRSLQQSIRDFFNKTNHHYTKFNYLGEWHSHPSFELIPSFQDQESMMKIVNDPAVGANFAVLFLVKLNEGKVEGAISLFVPGKSLIQGNLLREE